MSITLLQTIICILLTQACGYALLGFGKYFYKLSNNIESILNKPALIFILGLPPAAIYYSILGYCGILTNEYFLFGISVFVVIGLWLLKFNSFHNILSDLKPNSLIYPTALAVGLSPVIFYGIVISLLPTFNWDVISYGLTFPKTYASEQAIRYLTEYGVFSAFPVYGEAIIGFPYLLFKNELTVQLYLFFNFFILLTITKYVFEIFSNSKTYLYLLLISIGYLPVVLVNLGIAKVELVQASILLAALYFLMTK